jgi:selenocysteine lyase/cysteine desulfurase
MAEILHEFDRLCFVDFAASAAYVNIDMHPANEKQHLDAIFFSPHKFLGGPGSSGVIVFNKELYQNEVPDNPGGGTVTWTNPWGGHHYYDDIELREDGGTPGFLQGIKAALAILLKDEMGVKAIAQREAQLKDKLMKGLVEIPDLFVLEPTQKERLGYVSFYAAGIHHNLIVRLLNDRFGIQTRGGCSCAGTYGHILLDIDFHESKRITDQIDIGDLTAKPGWVRMSLHPTMMDSDVEYFIDALREIMKNYQNWEQNYKFNTHTGDFENLSDLDFRINIEDIFSVYSNK